MARTRITDDDEGKTVVNANGDEIGMVASVENGTAFVDPNPGITDRIRARLGWDDTDTDHYPLKQSSIEDITDSEIRLKQNL